MTGVWASVWVTLGIQTLASLVVFTPPVLAPAAQDEVGVHAFGGPFGTSVDCTGFTFHGQRFLPQVLA